MSPQDKEKMEKAIESLQDIFEELENLNTDCIIIDSIANAITLLNRQLSMNIEFIYTEGDEDEDFEFFVEDVDQFLAENSEIIYNEDSYVENDSIPTIEDLNLWYKLGN